LVSVLLVLVFAGFGRSAEELAVGDARRYRLEITCSNWCGESSMLIEERVVDTLSGETVAERSLHPREYEAVKRKGAAEAALPEGAPGRYQVATTAVGQQNQIMVIEAILDSTTGRIVSRKWLSPRVYDPVEQTNGERSAARKNALQPAGTAFGPGIRSQEFIAVLDTTDGSVLSRKRGDIRSWTRRDIACLPTEQWIDLASEPGMFQLSITARGADENKALIYETVLDTRDGRVVARRRVHQGAFAIER